MDRYYIATLWMVSEWCTSYLDSEVISELNKSLKASIIFAFIFSQKGCHIVHDSRLKDLWQTRRILIPFPLRNCL